MDFFDLLNSCAGLLFPRECVSCKEAIKENPACLLCAGCLDAVLSGEPEITSGLRYASDVWSCRPYSGAMRDCVRYFKFRDPGAMKTVFAAIIAPFAHHLREHSMTIDLVIPVPMGPLKKLRKGFNHAETIARNISGMTGKPLEKGILRKKDNRSQTGLSRRERAMNMKKAFFTSGERPLKGRTVLLVDDVITTGATIDSCAVALLGGGAGKVYGFTLAKTPVSCVCL